MSSHLFDRTYSFPTLWEWLLLSDSEPPRQNIILNAAARELDQFGEQVPHYQQHLYTGLLDPAMVDVPPLNVDSNDRYKELRLRSNQLIEVKIDVKVKYY